MTVIPGSYSPQNRRRMELFFVFPGSSPSARLVPFFAYTVKIRFREHEPSRNFCGPQRSFLDRTLQGHVRSREPKTIEAEVHDRLLSPELRLVGQTLLAPGFRRLDSSSSELRLQPRQLRMTRGITLRRRNRKIEPIENTRKNSIAMLNGYVNIRIKRYPATIALVRTSDIRKRRGRVELRITERYWPTISVDVDQA